MQRSMDSDLHLGQIAVRMGLIKAQDLPRLIQEARAGHVEESAGSGGAFAQMLLRKNVLSVSDYLYMADQARQERSTEIPLPRHAKLEDAFKSYESGELDLGSFEEIVNSTSGEPLTRSKDTAQRFGRYELLEEVARGGMGIVYRAREATGENQGIVALKVMIEADDDEVRLTRFEREAELCGSLDHPNIVRVFDFGKVEGMPYFTMDLVDGESLDDMLEGDGIPRELAIKAIAQSARAMRHAHDRGIIHRDLKPGNILIERKTGAAKVTDFGLARDLYRGTRLTQVGQAVGTPYYMAPEQVRGERNVDGRCDTYALGVILYEILTGDVPFDADSPLSLFRKIDHEPIELELDPENGIDENICAITKCALAKDREERYLHADMFADDLERYLRGETPRAQAYDWREALRRRFKGPGRSVGLVLLVLTVVVVLGLAAMIGVRRVRTARERSAAVAQAATAVGTARSRLEQAKVAEGPLRVLAACDEGLRALAPVLDRAAGPIGAAARARYEKEGGPAVNLELRRLHVESSLALALADPKLLPRAEASVQAATKLEPHAVGPRLELARTWSQLGRLDAAKTLCDELVQLDASERALRLLRASVLVRLRRSAEAESDLRAILLRDAKDVEARAHLARALISLGKLDDARAAAKAARDLAPKSVLAKVVSGDADAAAQRYAEAREHYREACELAEDDPGPRLALGSFFVLEGSFHDALTAYAEAGQRGANVEALLGQSRAHAHLFELEQAESTVRRGFTGLQDLPVRERAALAARLHVQLGVVQLASDRLEEARASFQAARALGPAQDVTPALLWLTRLAIARGDAQAARPLMEEVPASYSQDAATERSRLALLIGERARAQALAERAIAMSLSGTPAPRAQRALADALAHGQDEEAARRACGRAWSEAYRVRSLAGSFLRRAREWTELRQRYPKDAVTRHAESLLSAALRLDPSIAPAYSLAGRLAQREDRVVPAWRSLEHALKLDPYRAEPAVAAAQLALRTRNTERMAKAAAALERVREPKGRTDRLLLLARIHIQSKELSRALQTLKRVNSPSSSVIVQVESLRAIALEERGQNAGAGIARERAQAHGEARSAERRKLREQAEGNPAEARQFIDAALRLCDPARDDDYPELSLFRARLTADPLVGMQTVVPGLFRPRWDILDRLDAVIAERWTVPVSPARRQALIAGGERSDPGALLTLALAAFYDALLDTKAPAFFRAGLAAAEQLLTIEPGCLPAHMARGALRLRVGSQRRALRELSAIQHAYGDSALFQFALAEASAATGDSAQAEEALVRAKKRSLARFAERKAASRFVR